VRRLAPLSLALSLALNVTAGSAAAGEPDSAELGRLARALAETEAKEGANSPYLLPMIEEIARFRLRQGEFGETAELRRRALDIAIARFGCDSASAAEAMVALAMVHIDRRRYLDAEPLLIAAQITLEERVAPDHPAMAAALAGLARVASAHGDKAAADQLARRAVDIARKNPHRRSTEPLRALGAALAAQERFAEAREVLNEALAEDREHHGPDALGTARTLAQLGNTELRAHRFAEALPLIQQAMTLDQERLGAAHPFIADDLLDLGLIYDGLTRTVEARRAFAAALAVLERGAGRETPRAAYVELELARLDRQDGKEEAAEAAARDAKRLLHKSENEERRRERRI